MRHFLRDRLSLKLGLTTSFFVVVALAVGFHLTYSYYREELLLATRSHVETEARLMKLALSHQMLETDDRSLISRMVQSFASETPVERVMLLDRDGLVQFSSDPAIGEHHFDLADPTCQVCHRFPAEDRNRATILDLEGGAVLRSVQPISNDEPCHECHDPADRMNGILIVDVPMGATMARIEHSVGRLAIGTAVVGLILIGGLGLSFRRFLLRRLFRFEEVARAVAEGDLTRRVPVEGNDALTGIEVQFNRMADSVGRLLARVNAQNDRLHRVMNSVDDGLVELDAERHIVATNEAFTRRFPGPASALLGSSCLKATGAAGVSCDLEGTECPALQCFRSGAVHTSIRTRTAPDGSVHHEEVRASPLMGDDGKVARVVEVWRDITDRRSAEARLAEYQRLASVGMLASGFSHEINTPLSSIGTCLEAIERVCAEQKDAAPEAVADIKNYAQIASEQVRRCGGITRQFLRLARGQTPDLELLDLRAVAELVARLVAPTAGLAGVKVEVEPEPRLPSLVASNASVQQVLLNLLINAIEASPAGGKVTVSFLVGSDVEVRVRDAGRGIEPADVPKVFEPFFSKRVDGTGLGLFVSLNLARAWRGDLRVTWSQPGVGTEFSIVFPRGEVPLEVVA